MINIVPIEWTSSTSTCCTMMTTTFGMTKAIAIRVLLLLLLLLLLRLLPSQYCYYDHQFLLIPLPIVTRLLLFALTEQVA